MCTITEPYTYYDRSDQNRRFRYVVPISNAAPYNSDSNLINLQLMGCKFKALLACRAMHTTIRQNPK